MEVEHEIFMQAFSFCQASACLIQFSVQLQPGSLHPTEKREQTILTTLQLKALGVLHCAPLDVTVLSGAGLCLLRKGPLTSHLAVSESFNCAINALKSISGLKDDPMELHIKWGWYLSKNRLIVLNNNLTQFLTYCTLTILIQPNFYLLLQGWFLNRYNILMLSITDMYNSTRVLFALSWLNCQFS